MFDPPESGFAAVALAGLGVGPAGSSGPGTPAPQTPLEPMHNTLRRLSATHAMQQGWQGFFYCVHVLLERSTLPCTAIW